MKKILCLILFACTATAANASLLGTTVHIAQNYPVKGNEFWPADPVVTNGVEYSSPQVTINVGASAVDLVFNYETFVSNPTTGNYFNGPIIAGIHDSSGNPLIGFSNFSTTSSFSASDIIFGDDFIGFDVQGISFTQGQTIHVGLNFGQQASVVPEPQTIALIGLGLLGFAASRRKLGK